MPLIEYATSRTPHVKMAFSSMKVMIYGPLIIAKTTTSA
jgi:hypothetical protein